jgi:biotin carboxylase
MRKVLLLGGSHFQVPSVKTAKKLGYYTITCDYLPNNPGHKFADEYFNISTTDKDAVLTLAQKLKIDGIVCYASDPAAPVAAYVAEKMGLPTSPYQSVDLLCNKDKFRSFLEINNFKVPKAKGYSIDEVQQMFSEIETFTFPIMLKPVDSSGSKGVAKIDSIKQVKTAINNAMQYSRCKRFIIEDYVEKNGYQIAGDGFSVDGELVFRCFANEHFDSSGINPYVPVGESWPYIMNKNIHNKLHDEIQRAITLLGMRTQAYNFDARIDDNENVYLMEIGPRNGGNLIAQVTQYATGVDMVAYTIKAAMGEDCSDLHMIEPKGYWSNYMIHSQTAGILKEVWIDEELKKSNIVEYEMINNIGDEIEAFTGSNGTLGTLILKFSSQDEMIDKMDNMEQWIKVITER